DRDLADAALLAVIDRIYAESRQTYGSPRVHAELRLGHDIRVGRKRVERLMRQGGLVAVSSRRRRGSTRRHPQAVPAPDLVDRDFTATRPDQLWIADFTQVATWQGVAYIAVVADAYSRLCLGWRVQPDKTAELLIRQAWKTIDDVSVAVFEWLEAWYNRRRRHSALGYLAPLEYEDQHTDGHQLTNP